MAKKDYSQLFQSCKDGWEWEKTVCKNCIHYDCSDRLLTIKMRGKKAPYVVICKYSEQL